MYYVLASILLILSLISPKISQAYYSNMPASVVIGQQNFTSGSANQGGSVGANTLYSPEEVYYDPNSGKLFIADTYNNRVLIFNSIPTSNNASADIVIGQQNFTSNSANQGGSVNSNTLYNPRGVFVYKGQLFVVDSANHRILIFNSIPTTNNATADIVIGQTNLTSNSYNQCNCGTPAANTLMSPYEVFVYNDRVYVTDTSNHRVLIYNSIPTSNNASADVVLGQDSFATRVGHQGGVSASSLGTPMGLLVADNKLLVGDVGAYRVLVWNNLPTVNKAPADVVIGQPDFTSYGSQVFGVNVRRPMSFAYDGKRLYIVHDFSGVVSIRNYGIPTSNFQPHNITIGEVNVTPLDDSHLHEPRGITLAGNKMIVADSLHTHRVMIFENIITTPEISITDFEGLTEGKIRVKGNVRLGEAETYNISSLKVNINGSEKFVSHINSGSVTDGVKTYDYYHDFYPWENSGLDSVNWKEEHGYTLKLTANSQNADSSSIFYFSQFNLKKDTVDSNKIILSVPKKHVDAIKGNVDHFEILTKNTNGNWEKIGDNISTDLIDEHGTATFSVNYLGELKARSVSKGSGWHFDSNVLNEGMSENYINPFNLNITNSWFPLQINSISSINSGIISSFGTNQKLEFETKVNSTNFKGIAFSGSTIAIKIVDKDDTSQFNEYETKAVNSRWDISTKLFSKSLIYLSVYDTTGKYNLLPPILINRI